MPLSSAGIVAGQVANASEVFQFFQALTGVMTDQPFTLANSVTATSSICGTTLNASTSITAGTHISLSSAAYFTDISGAPTGPGAGITGIYTIGGVPHYNASVAGTDRSLQPMTTSGDIIYGGAAGTPTRLAAGSSTNVLQISSGNPVWMPVPGYKLLGYGQSSTNQSITSSASPGTAVTGLGTTAAPDGVHNVKVTVDMPDMQNTNAGVKVNIAIQKDGSVVGAQTVTTAAITGGVVSHFQFMDTTHTSSTSSYLVSIWMASSGTTLSTVNADTTTVINSITVEQTSS